MPLVISSLGQTHTCTCRGRDQFLETRGVPACGRHAPGLKIHINISIRFPSPLRTDRQSAWQLLAFDHKNPLMAWCNNELSIPYMGWGKILVNHTDKNYWQGKICIRQNTFLVYLCILAWKILAKAHDSLNLPIFTPPNFPMYGMLSSLLHHAIKP